MIDDQCKEDYGWLMIKERGYIGDDRRYYMWG
jgi:hypothetical protein